MAKAPKSPGKNGPSTPRVIFDALDTKAGAIGDGYWRAQVLLGALPAAAMLFGGDAVAPWLASLREHAFWRAESLARAAEGHARAGRTAEADAAIAASREALAHRDVDGETGTLAWRALAYALHARGDERGVDEALAAALACAKRERQNPTQPWPHLVRAWRVLGRDAALLAHYADVRERHLSFEDATSAQAVVSRAVERGDVASYLTWRKALDAFSGYETHLALRESAPAAARAGHGEALFEMLADFATQASYGDYVASEVCTALAGDGHLGLARRVLAVTRERFPRESELLATLARDLGAGDDLEAQRAYFRATEATHPDFAGESFVQAFRARYAIDRESAMRLADVREAALRAQLDAADATVGQSLVTLGVALASVGENPRGTALVDEAVKVCAGLHGGAKSSSLQFVGPMLARYGLDDACLTVLRKMTSKHHRTELSKPLSLRYVAAKDYAGAVAVVGLGDERALSQAMRLADALCESAGLAREFSNYV